MYQPLGRVLLAQALEQLRRQASFVLAEGGGIPLRGVGLVDGDKRRLATHGQAHIMLEQITIDLPPQGVDGQPLLLAVRLGDAGCFPQALHRHFMDKLTLARFNQATDRRG
ncbi:hypothetical protein D9M71_288680 [compost metagenome]